MKEDIYFDSSNLRGEDKARIILVDAEPITLLGLETLIKGQSDFSIMAMMTSSNGLVSTVKRDRPDVLLMDLRIKGQDALEIIEELSAVTDLPTRFVILTSSLTDYETCQLVKLGVSGVLLKEMPTDSIVQCLRQIHEGMQWLDPRTVSSALSSLLKREQTQQAMEYFLSKREMEIATLIAQGSTNKVAARTLNLSEGSVRVYLSRIYKKLDIGGRLELSIYFREKGFL